MNMPHTLSIRFRGGSFDYRVVTEKLGLSPDVTSDSPQIKIQGKCYWSKKVELTEQSVPQTIEKVVSQLLPYSQLFGMLKTNSVSCEMYIGVNVGNNTEVFLDCELMRKVSGIGFDLFLDLYPT